MVTICPPLAMVAGIKKGEEIRKLLTKEISELIPEEGGGSHSQNKESKRDQHCGFSSKVTACSSSIPSGTSYSPSCSTSVMGISSWPKGA